MGLEYDDSASLFFALAVIGPYSVGAGIYLLVKIYSHFTRMPKYPQVSNFPAIESLPKPPFHMIFIGAI